MNNTEKWLTRIAAAPFIAVGIGALLFAGFLIARMIADDPISGGVSFLLAFWMTAGGFYLYAKNK